MAHKNNKRVRCTRITRIVGYARPIDHWNIGKSREWAKRNIIAKQRSIGLEQ
ncbi:MAG: hypothetical protein GXO10_00825 [Crenarchaeota archaeon]|nr:hypothetical protein [Thermoproteota archaeon]